MPARRTSDVEPIECELLDAQELLTLARLDLENERFGEALVRLKIVPGLPGNVGEPTAGPQRGH